MKNLKTGDLVMIVVIIVSALAIFGYYHFNIFQAEGKQVIIELNGQVIKTIDLPQNELVQYKVQVNEVDYNLVEVLGEKVRIKEATCPDQLCVKEGWMSKAGQAFVCLPHKLVVRISGQPVDDGVDLKTF